MSSRLEQECKTEIDRSIHFACSGRGRAAPRLRISKVSNSLHLSDVSHRLALVSDTLTLPTSLLSRFPEFIYDEIAIADELAVAESADGTNPNKFDMARVDPINWTGTDA